MKSVVRLLGYMRAFWLAEVGAYLCMLGINGVRLISPQLTRRIVDVGITENRIDVLTTTVFMLLGITVVQGVFRFGEGYLTNYVSQNIAYRLRNELYQKVQSLSFSYHDRTQAGQLLSRMTSDVERLQRITGRGFLRIADTFILITGTMIILFQMQPQLAALSLVTMPVIIVLMRRFMRVVRPLSHKRQDRMGVLTTRLEQNMIGTSVVRGFAQEEAEIERFGAENTNIFDLSMDMTRLGAFTMPLIILLASVSSVMILLVGGGQVIDGWLTIGELIAFNTYLIQIVGPMRRLGFIATMMTESAASADRVFEILDAKSEVEDLPDAVDLGEVQGAVSFDHVTFSYLGTSRVLDDISFDIEPGQVVAILGPTGSGKSTITNLIPRFYDIESGAITIDGMNIHRVTIESLRKQIGIVLQETQLFGSTVRENIAFGRTDATQEQIEEAARSAAAHDFICGFPKGYDTEVGERGVTLSGGQRQRIAIARALLLDPRILILDDATSSVDTETERQIQAALGRLMEGRTSFVIAQRVSTVRNADKILVIDRGRIVAEGRHRDLIRESGIYADIYYRQLRPENQAELGASTAEPKR